MSLVSALGQNVPDGFDFASGAGNRAQASGLRIGFDKSENSMLVGTHAGGDGVPQHWRENRMQGSQVSDYPVVDYALQRRHQALVEERINDLPIGSIPADEQDFLG